MKILVLQICAISIVLLFTVLVIWMIRTLQAAKRCLEKTEQSFTQLGSQLTTVVQETSELLRTSRELTENFQLKAAALDSLFLSVRNVGDTVQQVTGTVNRFSEAVNQTAAGFDQKTPGFRSRFAETAKWIGVGIKLWQSRQAHHSHKP